MAKLFLSPEAKASLKKAFQEGFIYQSIHHHCGYKGNAYVRTEGGWVKMTHCPQCCGPFNWVPIENVLAPMIKKA